MSFPSEILKLADTFLSMHIPIKSLGVLEKSPIGMLSGNGKPNILKKWILAGGLSPENVISALKVTNTRKFGC